MVERADISKIKFDNKGLVPAIAQDKESGEVLMLAYMNRESLAKTIEGGRACFYSRSREQLWLKGESSGNFLSVRGIRYDCDGDTILLTVEAEGPACHTGERSCFYRELRAAEAEDKADAQQVPREAILQDLQKILEQRKTADAKNSYVASLYAKGRGAILEKVAEEAGEFIEAAERESDKEVVHEAADLLFHTMVMLSKREIKIEAVLSELQRRFGTSGIEEKLSRKQKADAHE